MSPTLIQTWLQPKRPLELFRTLYHCKVYIIDIVTPTLNVSRKFSMCIIFSTGYIKIYNLNTFEWIFYTTIRVRTSIIQHYTSKLSKCICIIHDILQWVRTSTCWNIHSATSLQYHPIYLKQIRIAMRHNVSVSST